MSKKKTTEEFIKDAKAIHGEKYDYSLVDYKTALKCIVIHCGQHGNFHQTPNKHLGGQGCYKCGVEVRSIKRKSNKDEFLSKALSIHGNTYDYSLADYIGFHSKLKIICSTHGIFEQSPSVHYRGAGCPKCGLLKTIEHTKSNKDEFTSSAKLIHEDRYEYKNVEYLNSKRKVKITCSKHGIFEQSPGEHLGGAGCPRCGCDKNAQNNRSTTNEFVIKSKLIHGEKYDYKNVRYITSNKKVEISCIKHGVFQQTPNQHLSGQGCSMCNGSKGENEVAKVLSEYDINYKHQATFDSCRNINKLPFDFLLLDKNGKIKGLIEFQGIQHYKPIKFNKHTTDLQAEERFNSNQKRDKIKLQWCIENNISLLVIHYSENVDSKVKDFLNQLSISKSVAKTGNSNHIRCFSKS